MAAAVVANPFAGRYVEEIAPLMDELKPLGQELAARLLAALGGKASGIEAFGKAAIVGINGELEHAALWHAPGGHALREILDAKGFVPSGKMLGPAGVRLMIPLLHKDSVWVRSHFNTCELTIHDAPRPDEIVFAVAMGTGSQDSCACRGPHCRTGAQGREALRRSRGLKSWSCLSYTDRYLSDVMV